LTNRCHRYSIADKSNEGQDASLRVEMGNPGLKEMEMRASKKIEKVQLVLPPPRRPDTDIAKF